MSEDAQSRTREVVLMEQAIAFLESPIGRYLTQRAEREERSALEELATVNPEDAHAIRTLQNRVHVANSITGWLKEAIMQGLAAANELGEVETLEPTSVGGSDP